MDNGQFQNELQNVLDDMLYENLWNNLNQNRIPRNNTYYRRNTQSSERDNLYILNHLRDVMQSYNDNMHDYTTNIRLYLQIMELMVRQDQPNRVQPPIIESRREQTNQRTAQRSRTRTQTQMPQFLSYLIYPLRDASGSPTQRQRMNFQDVVVRPTVEQFEHATRTIIYNNDTILSNHRCPISLEDFAEGDAVRQIIHCGHAFSEESIQNWFQSNVRCPVCRHDIRQTPSQDVSGNLIDHGLQSNIDTIVNGLTANISSIINNYVGSGINENNDLVYNFEIPIYYNDLSGNSN